MRPSSLNFGCLRAWLFATAMVPVVFTTSNHYVLDLIGSVVLRTMPIAAAGGVESVTAEQAAYVPK